MEENKMRKSTKKGRALLLAAVLTCLLCGCAEQNGTGLTPVKAPAAADYSAEEIAMVVTPGTISRLDSYPNLKTADLSGSTCYQTMAEYAEQHPEINVIYSVPICGRLIPADSENLAFLEEEYNASDLLENLRYLPKLKTVSLPGSLLTLNDLKLLQLRLPGVAINYDVNVAGILCDGNAESIDLSALSSGSVPLAAAELPMLTRLKQVELTDAYGQSRLTVEDVAMLQSAAPDVVFHYSFELFGRMVSTTDQEVYYADQNIGNQENAEYLLRRALNIMRGCKRFVLDNCKFDNETLARIREEYRGQTKVVWRVWFSTDGSSLTDREMLRVTFHLKDSNCHDLVYCEDVKYLDIGHNEQLYNIDFIAGMPNLVAVIVSGAPISDMAPFAGCTKLEMLEVAFCGYVKDISPLAECASLERVNIGFTKVDSLSVLDDKNITILIDTNTRVSNAERKRFEQLHPDALVQHSGAQPYGYPWRYLSDKLTYNEYYSMLRTVFDYDNGTNTHR